MIVILGTRGANVKHVSYFPLFSKQFFPLKIIYSINCLLLHENVLKMCVYFLERQALPCSSWPCQNGGQCSETTDQTDYTCQCRGSGSDQAFTGKNCEIRKLFFCPQL